MTRWPLSASWFALVCFGTLGLSLRAQTSPPATTAAPAATETPAEAPADIEPPPAATDPVAQRILENFITVEGGADALKKIGLIQATGTEYPLTKDAVPISFTAWIAPPATARLDTVVQQMYGATQEIRQVVNGAQGWTYEPTAKHPEVDDIAPAKLPDLVRLANFIYPFIDYESRGLRYQYTGKEKFRGIQALVVKAWMTKGPPEYLYFDPEKFLLLRIRSDARIGDVHTWANLYFTNYKKVGGIWFPTAWQQALSDAVVSRTEVKEIQLSPRADPALFTAPVLKEIVLRQATAPAPGPAPASH